MSYSKLSSNEFLLILQSTFSLSFQKRIQRTRIRTIFRITPIKKEEKLASNANFKSSNYSRKFKKFTYFLVNPFLLSIFLIRIAQKTRHRFSIFLIILRKLKITYSKSPRVNLQRFIFFFLFSRSHNYRV